jgi:hypothetical protein
LNLFPKRKESLTKYLSFIWPSILLEKAFTHNNFQIKTLALETLFELDFTVFSNSFPTSFLCETLIKALNEPRLYLEAKSLHIAEKLIQFYSNYIYGFETNEEKTTFVNEFLKKLGTHTHHTSLACFSKMLENLKSKDLYNEESLELLHRVIDSNCKSK